MHFTPLISRFTEWSNRSRGAAGSPRPRRSTRMPRLEPLEGRALLASGTDFLVPNSSAIVVRPAGSTAAISVSASNLTAITGVAFDQTVANFATTTSGAQSTDFTATINWGDGDTASSPKVSIAAKSDGTFSVSGTHTYATAGTYPVAVNVTSTSDSSSASASASAVVSDAAPSPSIVPLSGVLTPDSITGPDKSLNITKVNRPTLAGKAEPYAIVQLFVQRLDGDPTITTSIGQTIADANGNWTLTSTVLADGTYTISGSQMTQGGFPTAQTPLATLNNPLVIDTMGPRVAGLSFNAQTGIITVTIQDSGSGVYANSLSNASNYSIVRRRGLKGYTPLFQALSPAISGLYSKAQSPVLQFSAPISNGQYLFQVESGGVIDRAGNTLDGEFASRLPSGDGRPGGNFIASIHVARRRISPHSRSQH